jgi:ABC-type transporter Mla subunit MlaD
MEPEARYTYVGAAVLVLVAALVAAVVWLKDVGRKGDYSYYAINFERQSLDGLQVGADVNLRGIKVGRVEDYALSGQKFNRVRVEVRVDRRVPIRTNTVAVVTRNFVTDIAAITLVNPEPPGDPLLAVPAGEPYPLIGEGHSDLDEIAGRVSKVGEMASTALTNINQLLDAENREAVIATVRSLRELSAGLNQRLGTLDRTLQQVGTAATQLGSAGERIATVAERGGQRLDVTLGEAERSLAEARSALTRIAAATDAFQRQTVATARRLEDSAATVDTQLDAAVNELRLSVETATRTLEGLRDPRAALLGPGRAQLGPGERLP